jgi:protein SCO1/2
VGAVREAGRVIGLDRFAVLTVGFDARNDTPARMAQFASLQGITSDNWQVASADDTTMASLLSDLGFSYTAVAGGFEHVTQTTILDEEGRVYRHVYGEDFPLQMFIEPLKEAVFGTVTKLTFDGMIDHLKYICTTFDPGTRRYRFDYGIVAGSIIGALSLALMGGIILREWRRAG